MPAWKIPSQRKSSFILPTLVCFGMRETPTHFARSSLRMALNVFGRVASDGGSSLLD